MKARCLQVREKSVHKGLNGARAVRPELGISPAGSGSSPGPIRWGVEDQALAPLSLQAPSPHLLPRLPRKGCSIHICERNLVSILLLFGRKATQLPVVSKKKKRWQMRLESKWSCRAACDAARGPSSSTQTRFSGCSVLSAKKTQNTSKKEKESFEEKLISLYNVSLNRNKWENLLPLALACKNHREKGDENGSFTTAVEGTATKARCCPFACGNQLTAAQERTCASRNELSERE